MNRWVGKSIRYFLYFVCTVFLLFVFIANTLRLSSYYFEDHQAFTTKWISRILSQPVKLQGLQIHWHWFDPVIRLNHVTVMSATSNRQLLNVDHLTVVFDLWRSMSHWHLLTKDIYVSGVKLDLQVNAAGYVSVMGQAMGNEKAFRLSDGVDWLLLQPHVMVKDITLNGKFGQRQFSADQVAVDVRNAADQHQLQINLPAIQVKNLFSISNLQLTAQGQLDQGVLQISQNDGDILLKKYVPLSLQDSQLKLVANYNKVKNSTQYQFKQIAWLTHLFNLYGKGQVSITGKKIQHQVALTINAPKMALLSQRLKQAVKQSKRYHKDELLNWLANAFRAGAIKQATVAEKNGDFNASIPVQNVNFHYADGWPDIKQLNTTVQFKNGGMQIKQAHGDLSGMQLQDIDTTIKDLSHSVLQLKITSQNQLQHALNFLKQSPLDFAKRIQDIDAAGLVNNAITLSIPLYQDNPKVSSTGKVTFLGNSLILVQWHTALNQLQGVLSFKDQNLHAENLTAKWFGQPLKLQVKTRTNKRDQVVSIYAQGHLPVKPLLKDYVPAALPFVQGMMPVKIRIDFHSLEKVYDQLWLNSSLQGVGLNLDTLYHKAAAKQVPFKLHMELNLFNLYLVGQYGKQASAWLHFARDKQGFLFDKGQVNLAKTVAKSPKAKGLSLLLQAPSISWQQWYPVLKKHASDAKGGFNWHQVVIKTKRFTFRHQHFNNLTATIYPKANSWKVLLNSPQVAGQFNYQVKPRLLLTARIKHLQLAKFKTNQQAFKLNNLPNFDLRFDQLIYDNTNYNQVIFKAHQIKSGMYIDQLLLHPLGCQIDTKGYWVQDPAMSTNLLGKVNCNDYGYLLRHYGLSSDLINTKGVTSFALYWPGALYDWKLPQLKGDIKFNLKDGAIIHLNKHAQDEIGLGKLINILSVESIAKKLMLNFSDLKTSGFSFDKLIGEVHVNHGVAKIDNFLMDGPVAKVKIVGQVNYLKRKYDLQVQVLPYVTSSIPIIAAVIGGPVIGAATYVADKLATPALSHAAEKNVHLKGEWKAQEQQQIASPLPIPK